MGYSPWGHKELDTADQLLFTSLLLHCRQMFYHLSHQEAEKSLGSLNLKAEQIGFADGLITGYEREKSRVTIVKNYLNNVSK